MNVEKLNRLAEFLDTVPEHKFYLGAWFGFRGEDGVMDMLDGSTRFDPADCRTTACIAGWQTYLEYPGRSGRVKLERDAEEIARDSLGLSQSQADWLFLGGWLPRSMNEVWRSDEHMKAATPKQAAEAIRTLVKNEGRLS
jgi:hypothetical protein